jgi:arylsulfatase A-like enzyme
MTIDFTRRSLLKRDAMGGAALTVAATARPSDVQAPAPRPNVFILADDLGYADVSCYGRRDLLTPNIDRIAAQGTRFTQAYANSPVCTASRVTIITGVTRYACRLAWRSRSDLPPNAESVYRRSLEGGLRIPAIVFWPGRIPAGLASEQVTANMDWLPTLLAAAGTATDSA